MQIILKTFKGAAAPTLLLIALTASSAADQSVMSDTTSHVTGKVGLSAAKAVCCNHCEDITFGFIGGLGYDFNPYIGIEGRLTRTVWEYEQQEIKQHSGIFVKPAYPISNDIQLYGLIGYAQTKTGDDKVFGDNGLAWGAGINYYFDRDHIDSTKRIGLFLDYERMLQKSDSPDLDAVNFGLTYNF